MIKLWLVFFVLVAVIHFAIAAWRKIDGKERWSLTKSLGYSIIVSLLTVMLMTAVVVIF